MLWKRKYGVNGSDFAGQEGVLLTGTNISKQELIENNYGLVHACANKFRGRGVEYDDLFQAGCIGLIKAAGNFDTSRGFAFSTYAVPVILGEIKRIFRDGGAVKIGRSLKEKARHAMHIKEELATELGREPTISELAEKLGVDISQAAELITVSMPVISLTATDEKGTVQLDIPTPAPALVRHPTLSIKPKNMTHPKAPTIRSLCFPFSTHTKV